MSELYPPPPPAGDDPNSQYPRLGDERNSSQQGTSVPPSYQPGQILPGGVVPSSPYYPQWPPTQGAAPSQPLYQQPPIPGAYPSQPLYQQQPLYPQQPSYTGAAPSQPLYTQQQPYAGAAPSQPLNLQQSPVTYPGYPGSYSTSPTYVRTNVGEYWKNARNGKRNLLILAMVAVLFVMCGGISSALSKNPDSNALSTSGQASTSTTSQSNDQSGTSAQSTDTPEPTATFAPTATAVPTESPAHYKASATPVSVSNIAKQPSAYKNKTITFTAVILGFAHDSSGNAAGANVADPNDYSSVIQIAFTPGFSVTNVNTGDTITVWGQGLGAFTGTNAYGATITEGGVQEVYLDDQTTGYSDNSVSDPSSYAG